MTYVELDTNKGQVVYAGELDPVEVLILSVLNQDPKNYAVHVFRDVSDLDMDEQMNQTLEEAAPVHQEFFDNEEDSLKRAEQVQKEINAGTFVYSAPVLPTHVL